MDPRRPAAIRPDRGYFERSVNDTFPGNGAAQWQATLGDVVTAVLAAGLRLRHPAGYAEPFWRPGGCAPTTSPTSAPPTPRRSRTSAPREGVAGVPGHPLVAASAPPVAGGTGPAVYCGGVRELHADCARCFGLCCVALPFPASADFAVDKPAGTPCRNLLADFRCGIHDRLRESGYAGCVVYDCFGAGQRVSQGADWRAPGAAGPLFAAFPKVRALHEVLWYLTEALALPETRPLHDDLARARDEVDEAADSPDVDVDACRRSVVGLLRRAGELARAGTPGPDLAGADLVGRDLRARALRGASLRGALLVGADLRGVDLAKADLTGADLRGADLRGADLSAALFLTQPQLTAAKGDSTTGLPAARTRPAHWG